MTLQLEVGKTYRTRGGEIVRIVRRSFGITAFKGDNHRGYYVDGVCHAGNRADDLIEEDPFARVISALDDAERAETEAMERIRSSLAELRAAVEAAQKAMRGEG